MGTHSLPPWFAATPGRSSQRSNCCLRAPLMGPLWYGARRRYSLRLQYIFSFFKNTSPQDWPYRAKAVKWVVVCYSGRAQCAGSLYAAECTLPLSLTYTYLVAFARHGHMHIREERITGFSSWLITMNNTCPCVFSILHLMYQLDMPFAICHGVGASRLVDPLGGPALRGPRA